MKGARLAGTSELYEREKDDFYATDPESVKSLLNILYMDGHHFYEPCVGKGHIMDVLKKYYPQAKFLGTDLVDRGYPDTIELDFLKDDLNMKTDWVVTNPPYKHAQEFIERSLDIAYKGVAMFLKIQFLEGQKRKEFFERTPLKYVFVFSKRQDPWRDGIELNPETGKKWGGTMCFAWFIWEIGYECEPTIKWI